MSLPCDIVILAAGRGSRLPGDVPKPLLPLAGEPLIGHVLRAAATLRPRRTVIVTAAKSDALKAFAQTVCPQAEFVTQHPPHGTADAARCGINTLDDDGATLILCADTPLLEAATLRKLHTKASGLALMAFHAHNPQGYGRVLRKNGNIIGIVEEKDASPTVRKITEVFAGALAAPTIWLKQTLRRVRDNNAAGERYLTDLAALAAKQTLPITAVPTNEYEAAGVNTAMDLAAAETMLRQRRTTALLTRGALLIDPLRVDVRGQVRAAAGTIIDVNVVLIGKITLGHGCYIGAHSVLTDCAIGAGTVIEPFCHLHGARIGTNCTIGPYARIRPNTALATKVHVGNFVEIKNSHLAAGTKAGHLSYLGDSDIGNEVNIGAGVITCNYDGKRKHRTVIGNNAFIGSDTQLIAPVRIGKGAFVAAGTTVTKDAPTNHLTMARLPQQSRPLRKTQTVKKSKKKKQFTEGHN